MCGHMALYEYRTLFRVYAGGKIDRKRFIGMTAQIGRDLTDGDSMHIDHAVDALVVLLQADPVLQRSEIVAYRQNAARLYSRENSLLSFFHNSYLSLFSVHKPAPAGINSSRAARAIRAQGSLRPALSARPTVLNS